MTTENPFLVAAPAQVSHADFPKETPEMAAIRAQKALELLSQEKASGEPVSDTELSRAAARPRADGTPMSDAGGRGVNPFLVDAQSAPAQNPFLVDDKPEPGILSDTANMLGAGSVGLVRDVNEAVRKIPVVGDAIGSAIDKGAKAVTGQGADAALKDYQQRYMDALSPKQKEALGKNWITEDKDGMHFGSAFADWRSYFGGAVESLPSNVALVLPAMSIARGVYTARTAQLVAKGMSEEAAKVAASKTAALTGALAGKVLEGVQQAGDSSINVREHILGMKQEELQNSEAMQALMQGGLTFEQARAKLADDASTKAFVLAGVATAAFSGAGDYVLAKAITGGIKGGVLKRLGLGALAEGPLEEFPQSYLSKVAENSAIQAANPSQPLTEGAMNEGVGGAVVGALQGGIQTAALGHSAPEQAPQPEEKKIVLDFGNGKVAQTPEDLSRVFNAMAVNEREPAVRAALEKFFGAPLSQEEAKVLNDAFTSVPPSDQGKTIGEQIFGTEQAQQQGQEAADHVPVAAPAVVPAKALVRTAKKRLDELHKQAIEADPQLSHIDGAGQPVFTPGNGNHLTPEQTTEYDFLKQNMENPAALAQRYGVTLAPESPTKQQAEKKSQTATEAKPAQKEQTPVVEAPATASPAAQAPPAPAPAAQPQAKTQAKNQAKTQEPAKEQTLTAEEVAKKAVSDGKSPVAEVQRALKLPYGEALKQVNELVSAGKIERKGEKKDVAWKPDAKAKPRSAEKKEVAKPTPVANKKSGGEKKPAAPAAVAKTNEPTPAKKKSKEQTPEMVMYQEAVRVMKKVGPSATPTAHLSKELGIGFAAAKVLVDQMKADGKLPTDTAPPQKKVAKPLSKKEQAELQKELQEDSDESPNFSRAAQQAVSPQAPADPYQREAEHEEALRTLAGTVAKYAGVSVAEARQLFDVAPSSTTEERQAEEVAQKFGQRLFFVKIKDTSKLDFNAVAPKAELNRMVFLNKNADRPALALVMHELLHRLRSESPQAYLDTRDALREWYDVHARVAHDNAIQRGEREQGKAPLPRHQVEEEFIAESVEEAVMSPEFWEILAKKEPGVFRRVVNEILRLLNAMLDFIGERKGSKFYTDAVQARQIIADAFAKWVRNSEAYDQTTRSNAFAEWFGASKIVDDYGKPRVMYHGTARTFEAFKPKQAKAMFFSPEPEFTQLFVGTSVEFMREAGEGDLVAPQIIPVFLKADNPFDPDNEQHTSGLRTWLDTKFRNDQEFREGQRRLGMTDASPEFTPSIMQLHARVTRGSWGGIENALTQSYMRLHEHDGFYVYEHGVKNVAVYSPNQVKSVFNEKFDESPNFERRRSDDRSLHPVVVADSPVRAVHVPTAVRASQSIEELHQKIGGVLLNLKDRENDYHTFIKRGDMYYDLENPAGVRDYQDLNFPSTDESPNFARRGEGIQEYDENEEGAVRDAISRLTPEEAQRRVDDAIAKYRGEREEASPNFARVTAKQRMALGQQVNSLFSQAAQQYANDPKKERALRVPQAQRGLDLINKWIGDKMAPLGALPEEGKYLVQRNVAMGLIAQANEMARKIADIFEKATDAEKQQVYTYWTNAYAPSTAITNAELRQEAIDVKKLIDQIGEKLVQRGLLEQQTFQQNKGKYLPRLYLKHLLQEEDWRAIGAGKKPSDLGYTKRRKDIPEEIRLAILGEIRDPGFLGAMAVGKPLRDIALMDFLDVISKNDEWVWKPSVAMYKGMQVSVKWLANEASRMREQVALPGFSKDPSVIKRAEQEIADLEKALGQATVAAGGKQPEGFKSIPDTPRYGLMRGMLVREEIYNDLVGSAHINPDGAGWAEHFFGYGGVSTKAVNLWKTSKVALNPPGQIRNFISNLMLLQLSGMPMHLIPVRLAQAVKEIRTKGRYHQIAMKYGISVGTFGAQEMYRIEEEFLKDKGDGGPFAFLRYAKLIASKAGDMYQLMESIGKIAKIIDEMERRKTDETTAVIEANKWLFDYSLVPPSVRYLRNAPVGAPFITFYYKLAPRLLEVAAKYPWRFAPYVGMAYILPQLVAGMMGVSADDLERLKKALPEWLREKQHVYALPWKDENGRWQFLDLSYLVPWTMFTDAAKQAAEGKVSEVIKTTGLLTGPIPDMVTAIRSNKDAFTGRDIANPGDPTRLQVGAWLTYLYNLAAPPVLTNRGLIGPDFGDPNYALGGKIHQALVGSTNKFGEARATEAQAIGNALGISMYPINPESSRTAEMQRMYFEIEETKRLLMMKLHDRGLSDETRAKLIETYKQEMMRRYDKLRQFATDSELPRSLTQ